MLQQPLNISRINNIHVSLFVTPGGVPESARRIPGNCLLSRAPYNRDTQLLVLGWCIDFRGSRKAGWIPSVATGLSAEMALSEGTPGLTPDDLHLPALPPVDIEVVT